MMNASMIHFPPMNAQDEPQAQMESDFIQDELNKNGFDEIGYSSAFSALLQGLGWIKIAPGEDVTVSNEVIDYPVIDPLEYDVISAPTDSRRAGCGKGQPRFYPGYAPDTL